MSASLLDRLRDDRTTRVFAALYGLGLAAALVADLVSSDALAPMSSAIEPFLGTLTFVALLWGRRRLAHRRERGFWDLLAFAWLCRLLVEALYFLGASLSYFSPVVVADLLYLLFYLAFAVAIELRPHLGSESSPTVARRRLEGFAGLMAIFGLLVYFALVVQPGRGPTLLFVSEERGIVPFLLMRGCVDLFLFGRVLFPAGGNRGRWRAIYLFLAASLFCFTARALVVLLEASGALSTGRLGWLWSLFLLLPGLLVVLAARARHVVPDEAEPSDGADAVAREDMLRASPLALYILIVPVIHLALYPLGLLEPSSRGARDVFSLVYLLLVGFLAARHQKALEADRRRAVDSLETEIERRKRMNRELELRQTEMEQFTYTISHELRAPLVTIHGFTSLLERDLDENDQDDAAHLRRIRKATSDMSQLLTELLELSRVGWVLEREPGVSLSRVAEKVCTRLAIETGDDSAPHIWIDRDMPPVEADEPRLEDVLTNLVANAIKFTPAGERPRIHIGSRPGRPPVFFVSDQGRGIPPESQDKVFGLFNRLDHPEIDGTGVGLALVKRIVEKHGGRVWVESEGLGAGATFCFTLPPALGPRPVG